jgi:hypothetical protein
MNQKEPPLGGSRGTDALDVVVWFGSAAASSSGGAGTGNSGADRPIASAGLSATTGWPQRILTVGGIQHRTGDDPHSKHTAEAQQLVKQFYSLETATDGVVDDAAGGGLSLPSKAGPLPLTVGPSGQRRYDGAAWTPGPSVKRNYLHQRRPMSADAVCNVSSEVVEGGDLPEHDGIEQLRASTPHKSAYVPVHATPGVLNSGLFERRRAAVAHGLPRDSLALKLFRVAMEQEEDGSGHSSPKLGGRPPSGKTRPASRRRTRRPSSAASASSAASTTPSLEEARRSSSGRSTAPKTASDFPSVEKCRDLNSTLALTRAAAVLSSGGNGGAVSALIGLPTHVPATSGSNTSAVADNEPTQRQGIRSRLEAAGKPARPSSAVVSALRSTLGQSIMHTIRTTNAQQLLKVKHDMGPSPSEFAKQSTSHAQRLAHERLLYKHIPADEAARMKLRQNLEEMQTEFARVEIDARMDDFKRRIPTNGSKRTQGFGTPSSSSSTGASMGSDSFHHSGHHSGAPLTPAALHTMLNQHQQRKSGQSPSRAVRGSTANRSALGRNSVVPFEAVASRTPTLLGKGKIGHIPAQSRITIGGKEFMYSEFFRPLATTGNSGTGNASALKQ